MKVVISRTYQTDETLGFMFIMDDRGIIFTCHTLELPWLNNQHDLSCIPEGVYDVVKYNSPTKGKVFLIQGVLSRDSIEIHAGNYRKDTLGCILVGSSFSDINVDGKLDIIESRKTLDRLLALLPQEFNLHII